MVFLITTGDRSKSKFEDIGPYKGGYLKFGNYVPCLVMGKATIQLTDKIKCDNVN